MRLISVDQGSVIEQQAGGAIVVGTDDSTGEMVRFSATLRVADEIANRTVCLAEVEDEDVLSVFPTSGEWDSPGTSPEDGS